MSSKEIAIETGLSPRSVDTYLTNAMALLGASSRREAARMFASAEPSQELRSQPEPVAGAPDPETDRTSTGWRWLRKLLLPAPVGGGLHDLDAVGKSLLALRVGVAGVVVLLAIVTVFVGLLTIFQPV